MRFGYLSGVAVVVSTTLISCLATNDPSYAQSLSTPSSEKRYSPPKSFFCDVRELKQEEIVQKEVPTTLAQTDKGEVVIYYWTQSYYSDLEETSLVRCTRVAGILNSLKHKGLLTEIKAGEMNGKQVICVADSMREPCSRIVFPLALNENSQEVLEDFQEALKGKPFLLVREPIGISNILKSIIIKSLPQRRGSGGIR